VEDEGEFSPKRDEVLLLLHDRLWYNKISMSIFIENIV
jgi:hypothetical protein